MALTKATYSMIKGSFANVLDFGADPTGASDSLAAFNSAFQSASTVFVPEGTFLVSGPVQVPNNKNMFGSGISSIIRGNFAGTVLKVGQVGVAPISTNTFCRDLCVSTGALVDIGIQFEGVVKSNYVGLHVIADDTFKSTFVGFRIGGQIYSNTFVSLKAQSVSQDPSSNGIGFHIGNQFNLWQTANITTCNDNVFIGCQSNPFNVGFLVDAAGGTNLYGCNAEFGASYGLIFAGGQANTAYNFWAENALGVLFTRSAKENGSGGTTWETGRRNKIVDTPRFAINFVMEHTDGGVVDNSWLGGPCTIASTCNYCIFNDVTLIAGASIVDSGVASRLEYRDNNYQDYTFQYSIGTAAASGLKISSTTSGAAFRNLFNGIEFAIPQFLGAGTINANFIPTTDNARTLGGASNRWSVVYAGTGAINTSDERQKQDIRDMSAAEAAVATRLKGLIKAYRFKDACEKKGDDARIHVGVIAQEVAAAFESEGLDPMRYGVVCYDQWAADDEKEAGDAYGVRYDELLAFIISAL